MAETWWSGFLDSILAGDEVGGKDWQYITGNPSEDFARMQRLPPGDPRRGDLLGEIDQAYGGWDNLYRQLSSQPSPLSDVFAWQKEAQAVPDAQLPRIAQDQQSRLEDVQIVLRKYVLTR